MRELFTFLGMAILTFILWNILYVDNATIHFAPSNVNMRDWIAPEVIVLSIFCWIFDIGRNK